MTTLVLVHVIISLIAIVAGVIVMFGLLGSRAMPGLTAIFLILTILTNATGFVIPPLATEKLLPSHIIGGLSLVLLAIACIALYAMQLKGAWRPIYIVTAMRLALSQRFRARHPELPQGARAAGAGAGGAADHRPGRCLRWCRASCWCSSPW